MNTESKKKRKARITKAENRFMQACERTHATEKALKAATGGKKLWGQDAVKLERLKQDHYAAKQERSLARTALANAIASGPRTPGHPKR